MTAVDPIVLQIVEGTLASLEAEVETAIERTARSPMIRDQHDYRAGIHDSRCRKLTGRSYSAMVQPLVRDFPLECMREGDVFYHNDVYLSEGSVGHLPDLTTTVPVFHQGEVVAFVQAFGHHDDIGGMVPGSMPAHATSHFQEGLLVPPRDPVRLAEAIEAMMSDAALRQRMGAAARARAVERFDERRVTDTIVECYRSLLDRKGLSKAGAAEPARPVTPR